MCPNAAYIVMGTGTDRSQCWVLPGHRRAVVACADQFARRVPDLGTEALGDVRDRPRCGRRAGAGLAVGAGQLRSVPTTATSEAAWWLPYRRSGATGRTTDQLRRACRRWRAGCSAPEGPAGSQLGGDPTSCCQRVSVAPGVQVSTHAGSSWPGSRLVSPKQVQPSASLSLRPWRGPSPRSPAGIAKTIAWCTIGSF